MGIAPAVPISRRSVIGPQLFVFVVALVALVPFLAVKTPFSIYSDAPLSLDEGTYLHDGLRAAHGEMPYRDFFTFIGPLPVYLLGALFRLVGSSLLAARALHFLLMAAAAATLLRVAGLMRVPAGAVWPMALGYIFGLTAVWPLAYHHWVAAAFGIFSLEQAVRALESGAPQKWRWILAGVLAAAAVLSVHSYGLPLFTALVAAVTLGSVRLARGPLAERGALLRALAPPLLVVLGGLLLTVPVVGLIGAGGGLRAMVYDCWQWPLQHYMTVNSVPFGDDITLYLHNVEQWPVWSRWAAGAVLWLTLALPVLAIGAAAAGILRGGWRGRRPGGDPIPGSGDGARMVVALWAIAVLLPAVIGRTRADLTHVTFAGFGAGVAIWCPVTLLANDRRRALAERAVAALGLLWLTAASLVWLHRLGVSRVVSADVLTAGERAREASGAPVFAEFAGPGRPFMRLDWSSGWLHLYGPPSIVPYTLLLPPSSGYNTAEQWAEVARTIAARRPALVVVSPEGYEMLHRTWPEFASQYEHRDWLAWARDLPGEQTDESWWLLTHARTFTGGLHLFHYGRRVIGSVTFASGNPETVFGIVGDGEVKLIRLWPNGFFQTHLGRFSEGGAHAQGDLIDLYGVRGEFEMRRIVPTDQGG